MAVAEQAIDAAFATAARRWERILTGVRVVLCIAMFGRSALIWSLVPNAVGAGLMAPMLCLAALYIAASIALTRSGAPIERVLKMSVALDTGAVFIALLGNVLHPWPGYSGLVNTPDIVGLAMATLACGLRLSPRTAVFGALLNATCFAALLVIDLVLRGMPPPLGRGYSYLLQASFLAGAAALAIVMAVRTRNLAVDAVRAALTAERAQRSLGALLHEHHDVRTLLSAARIDADRLAGQHPAPIGALVDDLRSGLDDVVDRINAIYARAHGELLTLGSRQRVEVGPVAHDVLERLGRRFPAVTLALHGEPTLEAEVAGGGTTLRRLLFNLVMNACEGDGARGAAHVDVTVHGDPAGGRVRIDVIDDGPGFAPELVGAPLGEARSTKANGSGLGLAVAQALAQASDGTLLHGNCAAAGARVSLSLPMAR
jgi:signal transduction histidine kinase